MLLVLITVVSWLFLAVLGVAVIAWTPDRLRGALVPAAPLIGAVAIVITFHDLQLVTNAVVATAVVTAGAAISLVLAARRGRLRMPGPSLRAAAAASAAGIVPFLLVLSPLLGLRDARLIQPANNNDAIAYVAVTSWLEEHRVLDRPAVREDAPAYGYVRAHLRYGLRVGEEFAQAAVATVTGTDASRSWYVAMALWLLLMPGGWMAAGHFLGLSRGVSLAAGTAASFSSVLASQAFNQNSASVLGIAFAPLALGVVAARLEGDEAPAWFTGTCAAALVGTYTEFVPLVVPALLIVAVARPPREWVVVVRRAVPSLVVALAVAPLVWTNATRSLLVARTLTAEGRTSSFAGVPYSLVTTRFLGVSPLELDLRPWWAVILAAALVVGVAAAVTLPRHRRLFGGVVLSAVLLALYLEHVQGFLYGHHRAVVISQPLVIATAVVGLAMLGARLSRRSRSSSIATVAGVVLITSVYLWSNIDTTRWLAEFPVDQRTVDASFDEADEWADEYAKEDDGSDLMIATTDFFEQHWLSYLLRDHERVGLPFAFPDYNDVSPYALFDGLRRYALVTGEDWVIADDAAVIEENARFRLVDTNRGPVTIALATRGFHDAERRPGGVARWMADDGELFILRSPDAPPRIRLDMAVNGGLVPLHLVIRTDDAVLTEVTLKEQRTTVEVPLPDAPAIRLRIENDKPAGPVPGSTDVRPLSVYVLDVGV